MSPTLDPVLMELIYHKFKATTEEMGIALGRTARSAYVRETNDFATALADLNGRFFAYPKDTGVSLSVDQDCSTFIAAVPDLQPGDVLITNHPYLAPGVGSHLPDINLLKPYFHEGRLICFGWSFAHCADVGGGVPSSISPSFDSIFQEGLQIPPMKMIVGGQTNLAVTDLLRANSRMPDIVMGDLRAQLTALNVGERRVAELIAQHGVDAILAAQSGLVAYGKARALAVLRRIPDGVYDFHDYLDDDFRSRIPVRFRCRMQVQDGRIHLDLTGTDPQLMAPYNVPTGGVRHPYLTSKLMHLLFTLDPELPLNYGIFENVTVHVPPETVMNPSSPAPVGIRHAGAIRFNDAVLGCLTLANADIAPAASGGTVIPAVVAQSDPVTGRQSVSVVQSIAGGAGATSRGDGAEGRDRSLANIRNTPTEQGEEDVSVRIETYALRQDSGGAGRHRGGAGVVFTLRFLAPGMQIMGRGLERFVFQPWGVQGGQAGAMSRVVLNLGEPDEQELGKIDRVQPKVGDTLTIMTPGGGGFGDPRERDPLSVADDVRRGLVSLKGAAEDYGVVVDPETLAPDEAATVALRRAMPRPDNAFGPARALWESLFDDPAMTAFVAALLKTPSGMRDLARRQVFEAAAPGVSQRGPQVLAEPGFDLAAARAVLAREIAALNHRWAAASPANIA
jgi:N-methylhydantoinase B